MIKFSLLISGIMIYTILLLPSCKDKNHVVVYTSVDQVFSEPVLMAFENKTGIKVKAVYDTEEAKSTGVLNRLLSEKDNPRCDVFWSGDPMRADVLRQKDISEPYHAQNADGINSVFIEKNYNWIGFSSRARVLLINTRLVKEDDVPESILNLTEEKYRGMVAIANPLFGTTSFHIAGLFVELGDENATRFMNDLKRNDIVIATSNGDVKKKVSDGEVSMGLTDSDDGNEAVKEGLPVKMFFLDQSGIGNLIVPNTVSLIRNSPNNENGKKMIEYLLSSESERMLAESCAQMPLHKGIQLPANVPSLDDIKPMNVDYKAVAEKSEQIRDFLKQWTEK